MIIVVLGSLPSIINLALFRADAKSNKHEQYKCMFFFQLQTILKSKKASCFFINI
jgi:hypothetical protein